ncbi:hypothetical protein SAMN02910447_02400 [Ruminococcus sp. YE71]|uniref:hypothetical protein n=1 Tax=unclassified Ruminococcus TaxID=2608920 RepID=UPI0008915968|nr:MULTISPECIES: hypothetical protein [unclassified Ruminococcus]SDA23913.1 hypothetical protein SAMN02910446_02267 [Ruminococcus sp. YE78]SFW40708.1 hypothetical protein SAMN02910447_02400 [Ruminococcus sp. YE71]
MFEAVFLAALVLAAVVSVTVRVRKGLKRTRVNALILIPVQPDDDRLELRVRACRHDELFADDIDAKKILLVTNTSCPNAFLAKELAQELSQVETVHISALRDYMIRNYYT